MRNSLKAKLAVIGMAFAGSAVGIPATAQTTEPVLDSCWVIEVKCDKNGDNCQISEPRQEPC